jgi:hypothetical protein
MGIGEVVTGEMVSIAIGSGSVAFKLEAVLDAWLASEFEGDVRHPGSRRWRRSTAATTP